MPDPAGLRGIRAGGTELFFVSDANDDEFEGMLEGELVVIAYDFDGDGECDTELAFVA